MRKQILTALISMACLIPASAATKDKTVNLRVIQTSDVHGHFFPYNFNTGKADDGSLARVYTYVKQKRAEYGNRLLLIDSGDILQGECINYYYNFLHPEKVNIAAQCLNYMKYDTEAVGNHDIEPGHEVYDKWFKEMNFPALGANIVDEKTGKPYIAPYYITEREGVKVAVLGMVTAAIPCWLSKDIYEGLEFREMVSCAKEWVKIIKEKEHADIVIGCFHSGREGGIVTPAFAENVSERIAKEVPDMDMVMYGHDHMEANFTVKGASGNDVVCTDPSCFARKLSDAEITVTLRNGKMIDKKINANLVDVTKMEPDADYVAHFQEQIDSVKAWSAEVIGTFESDLYSRDSFFGSSAFSDMINELQLQITGADISMTAPLAMNAVIKKGPITTKDMFQLYRFENKLYVLKMTGEEVRKQLEMSYDLWCRTMTSPDEHILNINDKKPGTQRYSIFNNQTFNFDSALGIDYEVDVTKPNGSRVRILRMSNGEQFDEKHVYNVALNSYRGNGGGELLTKGAGIPKEEIENRIISRTPLDLRYYLTEEIKRLKTLNPQPKNNWKFVPEEWAKPALERDRELIFGKK